MVAAMQDHTTGQRTDARLRFLAEAAVAALSGDADQGDAVRPDAPADQLRTLLRHAVPVLRASVHKELAEQIEAALAEG